FKISDFRFVPRLPEIPLAKQGNPPPLALQVSNGSCKPACTPKKINGTLGTALMWAENVSAASSQARAEDKLIFLLHVSGNFAREEFT
ncbi:MAG: hypothetical protein IH951_08700, partial [Bacteroidetes bacterium]|nr:hypothetical protein [Bacteroidota bacterium]